MVILATELGEKTNPIYPAKPWRRRKSGRLFESQLKTENSFRPEVVDFASRQGRTRVFTAGVV